MFAAQNGHTVTVERLLQTPGINVNAQNRRGASALIGAAKNGHVTIADRLLQMPGINAINIRSLDGFTALKLARISESPIKMQLSSY